MKLTPQYRQAEIENVNTESGTFDVVWTTGARVERQPWFDESYYEELEVSRSAVDLSRLNSGAPFLNSHNAYSLGSVIGVVEKAWIEGDKGVATIRLSNRPDIEPIRQDIKDKILRNISVGYSVQKYKALDERVNDKKVYRAVRWTPMEISAVAIPADAGAQFRANESQLYEVEVIRMSNETDNPAGTETPPGAEQPEKRQQDTAPTPANPDPEAIARAAKLAADAAVAAERRRSADIRGLVARSNLPAALADELVNSGADIEAARSKVLDAMIERSGAEIGRDSASGNINLRMAADEQDKFRDAFRTALLARARVPLKWEKDETGKVRVLEHYIAARDNPYRNSTLMELARVCVERTGKDARFMDRMDIVRAAITQSTSDFPILLEEALHKSLLAGFNIAADTWRLFCSIGSVSDFRPHNLYTLGAIGDLEDVTENGEYVTKPIPDGEKAYIMATRKGMMINVSREMIINDDMGVFNNLVNFTGRAAGRTLEKRVYSYLASNPVMDRDNKALFHSDHGNLVSPGTAMGTESLDGMGTLLSLQKDISGQDYLDIMPSVLLCKRSKRGDALIYNSAEFDPDAADNKRKPNKNRGLFDVVIATPRITGTEYYVFADPNIVPTIVVSFLDGQQEPAIEQDMPFATDGMRWKLRHEYGISAVEHRGAVKNLGA